jgi:7-cyano-7-deazaguanine synthase
MKAEAMTPRPKAVCLVSGGLDSSTCLGIARRDGYDCYALSFDYGQRHLIELESAARIAKLFQVCEHRVARIDLRVFGASALTADIDVPKHRSHDTRHRAAGPVVPRDEEEGHRAPGSVVPRQTDDLTGAIPITYVPARNTIFLSFAMAWAEVLESSDIFIGVNAIDYSGYPDCRPEFIAAFEKMANLATKSAVEGRTHLRIHTPLAHLNKAEIVKLGTEVGVDFAMTHSCYDPGEGGRPCGECDSCVLRRKGFEEAGIRDPVADYDPRPSNAP